MLIWVPLFTRFSHLPTTVFVCVCVLLCLHNHIHNVWRCNNVFPFMPVFSPATYRYGLFVQFSVCIVPCGGKVVLCSFLFDIRITFHIKGPAPRARPPCCCDFSSRLKGYLNYFLQLLPHFRLLRLTLQWCVVLWRKRTSKRATEVRCWTHPQHNWIEGHSQ